MTLTNRIIFPLTCVRIFSQKRSCLFLIKFCLPAERCQISNFLPLVNQWHVLATATWRAVPYLYRKWQFRILAPLGNRSSHTLVVTTIYVRYLDKYSRCANVFVYVTLLCIFHGVLFCSLQVQKLSSPLQFSSAWCDSSDILLLALVHHSTVRALT